MSAVFPSALTVVAVASLYAWWRMWNRGRPPGDVVAVFCVAVLFSADAVAAWVGVIWR